MNNNYRLKLKWVHMFDDQIFLNEVSTDYCLQTCQISRPEEGGWGGFSY